MESRSKAAVISASADIQSSTMRSSGAKCATERTKKTPSAHTAKSVHRIVAAPSWISGLTSTPKATINLHKAGLQPSTAANASEINEAATMLPGFQLNPAWTVDFINDKGNFTGRRPIQYEGWTDEKSMMVTIHIIQEGTAGNKVLASHRRVPDGYYIASSA